MNPRHIFGHVFPIDVTIASCVFVLVWLALFYAFWRSHARKRRNGEPSQRSSLPKVEISYGLAIAAVAGFVYYLSFTSTGEEAATAQSSNTTVDITGFQWCWQFSYPGHGVATHATCDKGDLPTMVVPVGQSITVHVTSKDVIHSWWVPHLRYKMDAFPHHVNTFTLTVDRAGRWVGRCAEFCGEYHYRMDFYVQAVSPAQYKRWLAAGGTGSPTA